MNDHTLLDLELVEDIINSADVEDVVILDENYRRLAEESATDEERTRYVVLSRKTRERMNALQDI